MYYLRRDLICERLRISQSASYRLVGSSYGARINSDEVVMILNRSRNRTQEPVSYIPSDLMTIPEIAGVPEVAGSGIAEREIFRWTKRARNPCPCFRLNPHTVRIRKSSFLRWIREWTRIRRRGGHA